MENSRKGSRLTEENKKIRELKVQLGDILYEKFKAGEITDEATVTICNDIKASEEIVSGLQAELEAAKKAQDVYKRQR